MNARFVMVAAVLGAALISQACASSPAAAGTSTQQQSRAHGSRDRITAEELATIDVQNALQAVQRLRPNFLQTHGGATTSLTQGRQDVVVYLNSTRMGGPAALADIQITDVKEIQYLNGPDATQRFGTGHGSGAIIVISK